MSADIILTSVATFIAGGGLGALINLKSSKKKGEVEVKVDEIGALHDIIEKVYEPTIRFQKGRIEELESEVKSLKEQLSIERSDRQRDMEMMNKRILAITSALGIKAATQLRDERGRYKKEGEIAVEEK
jgi:hypothetical protein